MSLLDIPEILATLGLHDGRLVALESKVAALEGKVATLESKTAALETKDAALDAKDAALTAADAAFTTSSAAFTAAGAAHAARLAALEIVTGLAEPLVACSSALKAAADAAGYSGATLEYAVYTLNQYLNTVLPHEDFKFHDLATFVAAPTPGHHVVLTTTIAFTAEQPSATLANAPFPLQLVSYKSTAGAIALGTDLAQPDFFLAEGPTWAVYGPLTLAPSTAYYVAGTEGSNAQFAFYAYVPPS